MIASQRRNLEERCREHGVRLEDAMPCVIAQDGEKWIVDVNHPAYPRASGRVRWPSLPVSRGPGAELSRLLKRFGFEPAPTCACRAKAAEMDAWGCDECSKPERIEEVVGVLREEAKARGMPFIDAVGRMLVKRAISNARRNAPTPSGPTA